VVISAFRPDTPGATRLALQQEQAELGETCGGAAAGILHWTAGPNLDQRKGYHLVEFSVFADEAAFQRFKQHPAHVAFANKMREAADWVIGDIQAHF